MLTKILIRGEPGAESAAGRAAKACGVAVGGGVHEGLSAEMSPQFSSIDLRESRALGADIGAASREQNILGSDATLWFGETTTKEAQTAVATCHRFGKPCMLIYPTAAFAPTHVTEWIREGDFKILNVTGNRDADEPGIGEWVEPFLRQLLQELGQEQP